MTAADRLNAIEARAKVALGAPDWAPTKIPACAAVGVEAPRLIAALRAVLDLCDRGESTADELLLLDLSAAEWGGAHAARNAYDAVRAAIEGALT